MPRLIKNNIISPASSFSPRQTLNNNTMKREFVFPLIVGVIAGVLLMMFWQFNARLNNIAAGVGQLQQATDQNTKTVGDIVTFINNATGANKQATPAATQAAPSTK